MFDPFTAALTSLWPILLLVLAVAALRVLVELRAPAKGERGRIEVRARQEFFTASELAFHKTLTGATSGLPVAVYPKVRVLDVAEPEPGGNYQTTLNKLRGQHLDWLLVGLPDFRPLVAIELDGASHQRERQRNADRNKDEALAQAGLPLVRVSARAMPDVGALRVLLSPHLPVQLASPSTPVTSQAAFGRTGLRTGGE